MADVIAEHRCDKPGCGTVMVFDGNHRDVCYASNAGFANFKGLDGQVRIGCQNTPEFKSLYCCLHSPTVATRQGDSDVPNRRTGWINNWKKSHSHINFVSGTQNHVCM